jgi:glycosyltransferase involved in cell wall biosynthesis
MDILFIHNNCPGQFRHIADHFAREGGHRLFGVGAKTCPGLPSVSVARYEVQSRPPQGVHPFAARFDTEGRRAESAARAIATLQRQTGMDPAITLVHPGWGENLPVREMLPRTRMVSYCEFYYRTHDSDVGFDPEFKSSTSMMDRIRINARNAAQLLAMADSDAGLSPTRWQASLYPDIVRPRIHVAHDGVDTTHIGASPPEPVEIAGQTFRPGDETITYVARNLEPYRGYHIFMRALPKILAERKEARVVIVGGAGVSYGAQPPKGKTWRQIFFDEVKDRIDLSRVIFAETLPYKPFLALLRVSRVHVYLTYPFVLSWSALEAMASECLIVGSATQPVEEVISHGENGLLVPFFDKEALAATVSEAAGNPHRYDELRRNARETVVRNYDLKSICLPAQLKVVTG